MTLQGRWKRARGGWMRIATHNVCENPVHYGTIASTFFGALKNMDILLVQESSDPTYEKLLAGHMNYNHFMPGPAQNDARLSVLKPMSFTALKGAEQFQPKKKGLSHERYITWAQVSGLVTNIIISSRHYWPSDHKVQLEGAQKDKALMAELARGGEPLVIGGDFNQSGNVFPQYILGRKVHTFRSGGEHIDWLHLVDGKDYIWKFPRFKKTFSKRTASDHPVFGVRAKLVKR